MPLHPELLFLRGMLLVFVLLSAILPQDSFAQSGTWSGRWMMTSEVGNPHVFSCSRTWRCEPTETVMYGADYRLDRTPSKRTQGVMVATGGSTTPNMCHAYRPRVQCRLWLTRR